MATEVSERDLLSRHGQRRREPINRQEEINPSLMFLRSAAGCHREQYGLFFVLSYVVGLFEVLDLDFRVLVNLIS